MTSKRDRVKVVKKIVVFFDICSSTSILEDLIRTENQKAWRDLLIGLKKYLLQNQDLVGFQLYKFMGDGWLLLFEPCTEGLEIFQFLEALCDKFIYLYKKNIKKILTVRISNEGLTFGMDIGSCIKIVMNQELEYIGRPLNVAVRLQGAIGQRSKKPANKLLLSNNLYATFKDKGKIGDEYNIISVKRVLKNISGGECYLCQKLKLK
jgi:hypothetical protein